MKTSTRSVDQLTKCNCGGTESVRTVSLQESLTRINWDVKVYNLEMLQVLTKIDYSNVASYIILRVEVHV